MGTVAAKKNRVQEVAKEKGRGGGSGLNNVRACCCKDVDVISNFQGKSKESHSSNGDLM